MVCKKIQDAVAQAIVNEFITGTMAYHNKLLQCYNEAQKSLEEKKGTPDEMFFKGSSAAFMHAMVLFSNAEF